LSNVIKAYSVRYDDVAKKTIDFQILIKNETEVKRSTQPQLQLEEPQEEFVEGLSALVVDALPSEEDTTEKASTIIENANNEAQAIIDHAKQEAERIKNDAFSVAQNKGYEDGMLQAEREALMLQNEYNEKTLKLQRQYEDMLQSLEPQMVTMIASLVQKVTGIVVEDKEDVILYLIRNAIKNMDRSNEYTIRVSKEDYEFVSMQKEAILEAVGREVLLYLSEDTTLTKNQCLIETDAQVFNCSLDNQLNNLITDLKLLGGI
jgi:Flagellar biosynthesis/type III secretory pathway protein